MFGRRKLYSEIFIQCISFSIYCACSLIPCAFFFIGIIFYLFYEPESILFRLSHALVLFLAFSISAIVSVLCWKLYWDNEINKSSSTNFITKYMKLSHKLRKVPHSIFNLFNNLLIMSDKYDKYDSMLEYLYDTLSKTLKEGNKNSIAEAIETINSLNSNSKLIRMCLKITGGVPNRYNLKRIDEILSTSNEIIAQNEWNFKENQELYKINYYQLINTINFWSDLSIHYYDKAIISKRKQANLEFNYLKKETIDPMLGGEENIK